MTTNLPIITDPRTLDNSPADLICPLAACRARVSFSSATRSVACQVCGWSHALTEEQHTDLLDAVLGISDLNCAAYLLILAAPAPPEGGAVPAPAGPIVILFPTVNPHRADEFLPVAA